MGILRKVFKAELMAFVRDLADAVVVLREGTVFDQGPAAEVFARPENIELCLGL